MKHNDISNTVTEAQVREHYNRSIGKLYATKSFSLFPIIVGGLTTIYGFCTNMNDTAMAGLVMMITGQSLDMYAKTEAKEKTRVFRNSIANYSQKYLKARLAV